MISAPTLLALDGDVVYALSVGACWLLAGLFVTRRPRPPVLAVAAAEVADERGGLAYWSELDPDPETHPDFHSHTEAPMPEIPDEHNPVPAYGELDASDPDSTIGDVVHTAEHPTIDDPPEPVLPVPVVIDVAYARQPFGDRAIQVLLPPDGRITAAQAAELQRDLANAVGFVAPLRQDLGYTS